MSELKTYDVIMTPADDGSWVLKSEADKVIAELKSEIERLEILCANYRHDCDNLAISNEQASRVARTLLKKMNYNKNKRCLAMVKWCRFWANYWRCCQPTDCGMFIARAKFFRKWQKRWLELAEVFK